MIRPCSSTMIASAFRTVDSLWAITRVVRSAISRSIPCSICFSVLVSTELVASSRIRTGALDTAALAIFKSCLCPWLKFAPSPSNGMIDYDPAWEQGGYYETNVEKAKALLAEAGIPEGTKVTIITNEDRTMLSNCEIIQAMIGAIGLEADILSYEKAVYNSVVDDETGGWDMATAAFTAPSGYVADMGHAYFAQEGINRSCYYNEELEKMVTDCVRIMDDGERKALTDKIVNILQEEVPAYAYTRQAVNWAWVKELKGFNVYGQNNVAVKCLYFEE